MAAERQEVTDRTASFRWYLRFKGEEKDFITVWFTLKQRTLGTSRRSSCPRPRTNQEEVFAYLLRRNAQLFGMWFALGPEDAVYLVGRVPARLIDDDELDRIAGSSVLYTDDHFPTAMTLAHPSTYRRRPRAAEALRARRRRRRPRTLAVSNVAPVANLLIVGGGKMGGALLGGLLRSGWAELADVAVVEPVAERRDELGRTVPGPATCSTPPRPACWRDGGRAPRRGRAGGEARRGRRGLPRPRRRPG